VRRAYSEKESILKDTTKGRTFRIIEMNADMRAKRLRPERSRMRNAIRLRCRFGLFRPIIGTFVEGVRCQFSNLVVSTFLAAAAHSRARAGRCRARSLRCYSGAGSSAVQEPHLPIVGLALRRHGSAYINYLTSCLQ
jgi:hypothetical protein